MKKRMILVAALALAGFGCDSSSGGDASQSVAIAFEAMVGSEVFVCGTTYDNLGADDSSLEVSDFRFYVQDVELRNADGDYVAVDLDTDGNIWQVDNVALLDFEEGCTNFGDAGTNRVVTGTVPEGSYDGLRFKMGVPFDLNHANPATAEPPLNLTSMEWNWQGGYKFLRIDTGTPARPTGACTSAARVATAIPLRVERRRARRRTAWMSSSMRSIRRATRSSPTSLNWSTGAALDVNQPETPVGCMAGPTDSDCAALFENLGLSFDGSVPGTQQFFSVE